VPPFESLQKNERMGGWFHLIPLEYQQRTIFWSQQILCALTNGRTIPECPELHIIRRSQCGYRALYAIMRSTHPRLMSNQPLIRPPLYDNNAPLGDFLDRWITFLILENEQGNPWTPIRAVRYIIGYLPSPHNTWIRTHFDLECAQYSSDKSVLPPEYDMKHNIHAVRHETSNDITGCQVCKDTRHNSEDCYKAIAAAHAFAKTPELAQRILKKYSKPPTPPRKSNRKSIHRVVFDDDDPEDQAVFDEFPASEELNEHHAADNDDNIVAYTDIDNGIQSIVLNTASNVFMDTANIHSCGEDIITPISASTDPKIIVSQYDGGANVNTTNEISALWNLHKIDQPREMSDIGKNRYFARYRGYLVFRTKCPQNYRAILTYYTPSIPNTVISSDAIVTQFPEITSSTEYRDYVHQSGFAVFKHVPLHLHNSMKNSSMTISYIP
jgi:hypothetical protein